MALLDGVKAGVDAIYPARCLTCGDVVDGDYGLCGTCWRDTSFIGGALCDACGVPLPGMETDEVLHCDECLAAPKPWQHGRAAVLYTNTGRKLVLSLKHGDRHEIARPAGLWMAHAARPLITPNTLIAPVPLHWLRMIKRRFNQSALLAKSLSLHTGGTCCLDLLQRVRRTRSLNGLDPKARAQMLENAIRVHPRRRHRLIGRPILLVDDVLTSGATLSACTEACLAAGSGPVNVVTLARVSKDA
ncbi:MAG: ComF family protein [Pseudomonadota bacterium]